VHEFCAARQYFVQEAYPGSSARTALVHGMLLDRKLKLMDKKHFSALLIWQSPTVEKSAALLKTLQKMFYKPALNRLKELTLK
jgi:hypothetical protein